MDFISQVLNSGTQGSLISVGGCATIALSVVMIEGGRKLFLHGDKQNSLIWKISGLALMIIGALGGITVSLLMGTFMGTLLGSSVGPLGQFVGLGVGAALGLTAAIGIATFFKSSWKNLATSIVKDDLKKLFTTTSKDETSPQTSKGETSPQKTRTRSTILDLGGTSLLGPSPSSDDEDDFSGATFQ